jgi:hypothetical protein
MASTSLTLSIVELRRIVCRPSIGSLNSSSPQI